MLQKISGFKDDEVNVKFITIRNDNLYLSPVIVYTSNDATNSRTSIGRGESGLRGNVLENVFLGKEEDKKIILKWDLGVLNMRMTRGWN
jgi:hypothetical protein